MDVKGKKIYIGLSGGVDSAVSAALLKEAGAVVTGVFIKGWYPPGMPCTWSEDRRDAMRVAARLHIPFITLDAQAEYKTGVIDYLLREYAAGRTPNPDVMCNREVKFGVFYRYAMEHSADYIATGHYARLVRVSAADKSRTLRSFSEAGHTRPENGGNGTHLLRGIDIDKDQSYFLWAIPREVLEKTLFPVGALKKTEVRALARKFSIPVAAKKDSQGVCFLGSVSVGDFLKKELGSTPGTAITEDGVPVGVHEGALLYTLGERVGLTGHVAGPWYVVSKRLAENVLVVSNTRRPSLEQSKSEFILEETNWIQSVSEGESLDAQYRYHGPRIVGTYKKENRGEIYIAAKSMNEQVAAGQSLVIYRGDELCGGGTITI